ATQWVPMLELLRYSNRKIVGAELGYIYLPPWYLLTLFFPNLFGAAYDTRTLTLFTALGVSHDHVLYIGIAGLAPVAFALFWWRRSRKNGADEIQDQQGDRADDSSLRNIKLFGLLGAVSLLVMVSTPVYVQVTRYIPVLQVIRVAVR